MKDYSLLFVLIDDLVEKVEMLEENIIISHTIN